MFSDINCGNIFLDHPPKAKQIEAKINKWDLIKYRSFCTTKESLSTRQKDNLGNRENICKGCDLQMVDIQTSHTIWY